MRGVVRAWVAASVAGLGLSCDSEPATAGKYVQDGGVVLAVTDAAAPRPDAATDAKAPVKQPGTNTPNAGKPGASNSGAGTHSGTDSAGQHPDDADSGMPEALIRQHVINFATLYSAYDGVHDYTVSPWVPLADPATDASREPIVASSLAWHVDEQYVQDMGAVSDLPGGRLLRTRRAGSTLLQVTGSTRAGVRIRGQAALIIAQADAAAWELGNARYDQGPDLSTSMLAACQPDAATRFAGKNAACTTCHDASPEAMTIAKAPTPTQTTRYTDNQLRLIFSQATKPAGDKFVSTYMLGLTPATADCLYRSFHTWQLTEEVQKGLVWKLRSLAPQAQLGALR